MRNGRLRKKWHMYNYSPRRIQNKSKTNCPDLQGDLNLWIEGAHPCREKPMHTDVESSLMKIQIKVQLYSQVGGEVSLASDFPPETFNILEELKGSQSSP